MQTMTSKGKMVNIPDKDIEKNMRLLDISEAEAIHVWLVDHDLEEDEELEEFDARASKVKIDHGAESGKTRKKSDTPRVKKISDEKQMLFSQILANLQSFYANNVTILNENKLISVKVGDKVFKVDLIETRTPKNK